MRHFWALIALLLLFRCAAAAGGYSCKAPLCNDAAAARAYRKQATAAGRCFAVDILHGTEGTLLRGSSEEVLPAGRYCLHVPLAMAPLGDLNVSFITITLSVEKSKRVVTMLHFPSADAFTDVPLEFIAPGGTFVPFSISWSLSSDEAKRNRLKALNLDIDPEHGDVGEDITTEAPSEAADGTISTSELGKIPDHLAACGVHFEALCPVAISNVTTDKITYHPGEPATASLSLTNHGAAPVSCALTVDLVSGFDSLTPLYNATLDLPPGESKDWSAPFATKDLHWGTELRATAKVGNAVTSARYVFAVNENFWETALVSGFGPTVQYRDPKDA